MPQERWAAKLKPSQNTKQGQQTLSPKKLLCETPNYERTRRKANPERKGRSLKTHRKSDGQQNSNPHRTQSKDSKPQARKSFCVKLQTMKEHQGKQTLNAKDGV